MPQRRRKSRVSRLCAGICSGTCGMTLKLENGMVATIEGDDDHPLAGDTSALRDGLFRNC